MRRGEDGEMQFFDGGADDLEYLSGERVFRNGHGQVETGRGRIRGVGGVRCVSVDGGETFFVVVGRSCS